MQTHNVLCRLCRRTASGKFHNWIDHHTETGLKISAAKGCQICRLLFLKFRRHFPDNVGRCERLRIARLHGDSISVKGFNDAIIRFEVFGPRIYHPLPFAANNTDPLIEYGFRATDTQPDTRASYDLIKTWLIDCIENHRNCDKAVLEVTYPVVPQRLIAVTGRLRLVELDSMSDDETYAALSHCWGSSPRFMATKQSVEKLKRSIDPATLPKTFRDAIELTQKLRIDYLWIDALCILQDSEEDWQAESIMMGYYYRNAHLTISALDASDGTKGFLHTPRTTLSARIDDGESWREAGLSWGDTFRQSPLSRRGWVLQERLLSRRVLHFAKDELLWECMECSARERTAVCSTSDGGKRVIGPRHIDDGSTIQIGRWYDVVCQYSELELTFDHDVLAAIEGISSTFMQATGLQYAAGLWQEHLPYGLLWYCERVRLLHKDSVAPTWSWASRRGPIKMLCNPPDWVLRITEERPANQLSAMNARLETLSIAEIDVDMEDEALGTRLSIEAWSIQVLCSSSSGAQPPFDDPDLRRIISIHESFGFRIGTGYWDCIPDAEFVACTAILLMQAPDDCCDSQNNAMITYFLLVKEAESVEGQVVFERIGIGCTVDLLEGQNLDNSWLKNTQRQAFTLR